MNTGLVFHYRFQIEGHTNPGSFIDHVIHDWFHKRNPMFTVEFFIFKFLLSGNQDLLAANCQG